MVPIDSLSNLISAGLVDDAKPSGASSSVHAAAGCQEVTYSSSHGRKVSGRPTPTLGPYSIPPMRPALRGELPPTQPSQQGWEQGPSVAERLRCMRTPRSTPPRPVSQDQLMYHDCWPTTSSRSLLPGSSTTETIRSMHAATASASRRRSPRELDGPPQIGRHAKAMFQTIVSTHRLIII